MNIQGFPVGPLQANCYVLDDGERAVVVDPGGSAQVIVDRLRRQGLSLHEVWLTHAHFDHVGALAEIVDAAGTAAGSAARGEAAVRMHPADELLLASAATSAAAWGVEIPPPPTQTVDIADDEVIEFAGTGVRCLHTPGHAPGHVAFWIASEGVVLAGDALFRGSVGRTDLPFGNREELLTSIRVKLLALPPETTVLPGHGPATAIGIEARSNPFLI